MKSVYEENADIFKAFCDKNRLQIIELLCQSEKCACVILEQLDMGQSGLSYHMKILVESGIVESRQEGKWTHYKISENGRDAIIDLMKRITSTNTSKDETKCCK